MTEFDSTFIAKHRIEINIDKSRCEIMKLLLFKSDTVRCNNKKKKVVVRLS